MNKTVIAGCVLIAGSLCAGSGHAAGVDLALGNETANLQLLFNPRRLYENGGAELAVGAFVTEEGDLLANATLMAGGLTQTPTSQYHLGAGFKLLAGDIEVPDNRVAGGEDDESVAALALGFQLGVLLNPSPNPVEFSVEAFYAPKITSFSEAESYSELGAKLQIDIIPQAQAYLGYRRMRVDTDDYNSLDLDSSAHVGVRILF